LGLYGKRLDENRGMIDTIAAKDMMKESIQKFFLDCYTHDFGGIPENPTTKGEKNRRTRAIEACNFFTERFDKEQNVAGATAWNAMNSYTGWLQHDKKAFYNDPEKARESRIGSSLFGVNAERAMHALQVALSV
ncbi:hypothetical protein KAR91_82740, partial [Candidatus Pacearchaeota archaeon]|nr:hypothetical protein [Candidatus Pacearchaeota archaeon]